MNVYKGNNFNIPPIYFLTAFWSFRNRLFLEGDRERTYKKKNHLPTLKNKHKSSTPHIFFLYSSIQDILPFNISVHHPKKKNHRQDRSTPILDSCLETNVQSSSCTFSSWCLLLVLSRLACRVSKVEVVETTGQILME